MKLKIKTDRTRRIQFSNSEINRTILKYVSRLLLNDSSLKLKGINIESKNIRFVLSQKMSLNTTSKTKIVRRCILTGRGRVSYRYYGISRVKLRELFQSKQNFFINKYSW